MKGEGNLSFMYLKGPFIKISEHTMEVYERVPFLPKMVHKRVRGRTSGRSLPVLYFLVPSPGYPLESVITLARCLIAVM